MWKFIIFEWKYWFKSPLLWILLLVNTLLVFGAVSSDNITIGGGIGNVYKNAPHVVQTFYGVMSLLGLLMVTAFMNGTAGRDFTYNMDAFVFSSPIKKQDYFFGKFIGALTISIIPLLGVSLGALIGPLMPWVQPERYGDIIWSGHLLGIIVFAIPNTIIAGVLLFGLAILFRSAIVSWVGAMLILILTGVSSGLLSNLDNEAIAALLDPFGSSAQSLVGKYMTVGEKNISPVPFVGLLLYNRLLWVGFSILILLGIYRRFSFSRKKENRGSIKPETESVKNISTSNTTYIAKHKKGFSISTLMSLVRFESLAIMKNPTFIILVMIGVINLVVSLIFFTENFDLKKYPVTYDVIATIQGSFFLFLIGIIIFYSGVIVWRDRDYKINEIKDATPAPSIVMFISKLIAMVFTIGFVLLCSIVIGVSAQLIMGFTLVKLDVYFISIMVIDLLGFTFLIVLSLLLHYVINNRYLAYFAFVLFMITNIFLWSVLEVNSNMLAYGSTPSIVYSDMNGYGPFVIGTFWFNLYWLCFALLLSMITFGFYIRGNETAFKQRLGVFSRRIDNVQVPLVSSAILWIAVASFTYYNTQIINTYHNAEEREDLRKQYELVYKQYETLPKPTYYHLDFTIDLEPEKRNLTAQIVAFAVNRTEKPISELHFTLPTFSDSLEISIEKGEEKLRDNQLNYRIYKLENELMPGDSLVITYKNRLITQGFENEVSNTSITQNGSFFNNFDIMPILGYSSQFEIADKNKRKKLGLQAKLRAKPLFDDSLKLRADNYVNADWVTMTTKISTSSDQIAVAPGDLVNESTKDGRNYYEYSLSQKSLAFFSFISAKYKVSRDKWNDVDLEVYYTAEHAVNVPNMISGMKKSLDYYTTNFGPYYHKQARIIEFPRYSSFAQAFAGTMPYSESMGFITDLRDVSSDDIDKVFYVVAHEMGHQWWAHQVVGADMQGSEMLSETFAQYSALMVMEKEYGRDKMKKFLKYEMNGYLRGRGNEFEAERPIMETEGQGYIHYQKGSLVMYYLKEMISEDSVNMALRHLVADYAYQDAPYPTSISAVREFSKVTPDSLQYLIDDLFENITIFSNRILESNFKKSDDGYLVTINTLSEKYRSDSIGKQTPIPVSDYIDIAVFGTPNEDQELGEVLYYQRKKLVNDSNSFTISVKQLPSHVGIDPYNYLIDRIDDDNIKKVSEK
jgi:ABC-2 type transport system permease protein